MKNVVAILVSLFAVNAHAMPACTMSTVKTMDRVVLCNMAAPACEGELVDPDGFKSWAKVQTGDKLILVVSDRRDSTTILKGKAVESGILDQKQGSDRPLCLIAASRDLIPPHVGIVQMIP